jgi:hypothetical protein
VIVAALVAAAVIVLALGIGGALHGSRDAEAGTPSENALVVVP